MDLSEIIRTLYVEKAKVENSIAALEALHATHGNRPERAGRRGRKSMGDEERQQVSERMKKYWGSRREQQTTLEAVSSN
jgi:hypothetical protein